MVMLLESGEERLVVASSGIIPREQRYLDKSDLEVLQFPLPSVTS